MGSKLLHSFCIINICLLFFSCETKQEEITKIGNLHINGKSYTLDKALVQDWGKYQGFDESYEGHHIILGFFSPEAILHLTDDGEVDSISGTGHAAQFELFADHPQDIASQSFTLSGEYVPGTYSFGIIYTDFFFDTGSIWDGEFVQAGDLILNIDEESIALWAELKLPEGDTAVIEYLGDYLFLEHEADN